MGNTVAELIASAEYIAKEGNLNVFVCERGIRTFENSTRFTLDISAITTIQSETNLAIFVDPSHAAGSQKYVESLALAAVAAGCNGLIIEVHNNPGEALSDKNQQLTLEQFFQLEKKINAIYQVR